MRLYYEIGIRAMRRASTYRGSYLFGMLTNAFFGAVLCFLYRAIYQAGGSVAGFTLNDVISYVWLSQALISVGAGWLSWEIAQTIQSGDVVTDMSRPWSYYGYWLSQHLGEKLFSLITRGTITYLIGVLLFEARLPAPVQLAGFAASMGLALLIAFAYSFIVNLSAFWLLDISGVATLANLLQGFFSGFLLPLAFMPAPLAQLAAWLPFQAIVYLPAQVFLGQTGLRELPAVLALQLGWVLLLSGLGLFVQRQAIRKLVIQGG